MAKNENKSLIQVEKELLVYNAPDGSVKVEVLLQDENLWLSQDRIAELFGVERSVITKHLQNIFDDGELDEKRNVQKMHISSTNSLFWWLKSYLLGLQKRYI